MPARYVYIVVDPLGTIDVRGDEWQIFERYKSLPGVGKLNQGKFHQAIVGDAIVVYPHTLPMGQYWQFMRKSVL